MLDPWLGGYGERYPSCIPWNLGKIPQAITLNPNDAKVYNNRGSARNKLGDIKGALEDYTQAIRLNPDYAPAYYNRGVLRSQSGKRRAGMKDFREADALAQKQGDLAMHRQVKAEIKGN